MKLFKSNKDWRYKVIKRSKYFNKKWYLETYPDVSESKMDPVEHYLEIGWKKHHNPSIRFDGNAYLAANPDVKKANMNPLLHYETYGKKEGREIQKINTNAYHTNVFKIFSSTIKRHISNIFYYKTIQKNKETKILVVLHLYYMSSWESIKLYLDNLNQYKYDLIITYVDGHYQKRVLDQIKKYKQNTKFFVYPNKGFDIGAFIDVLHTTDIDKYDIIFKLHSKGISRKYIYIYNQIFKNKDWFCNLYNGILGAFSVHKAINAFIKDKNIGIVASENLIVHDPKHKIFFTKQIADKYKLKTNANYHYIAGSCFIIRPVCLKKIKSLKLTINSFSETQRGVFSLAHALERLICAVPEAQKFKIYGIPVSHNIYRKELKSAQKTSAIKLLEDKRFVLNYEFFYRSLETKKIVNYYIQKISLQEINRNWKGKNIKLNQCAAYKYLQGKTNTYKNYCKENKKLFNIEMSINRYDNLIKNIENKGFDSKTMPVINPKNNVIMDGQHRCCYLLNKYGPEHKVKALFIETE